MIPDDLDPDFGPVCEGCGRPSERCVCDAGDAEGQESLFDPPAEPAGQGPEWA